MQKELSDILLRVQRRLANLLMIYGFIIAHTVLNELLLYNGNTLLLSYGDLPTISRAQIIVTSSSVTPQPSFPKSVIFGSSSSDQKKGTSP